MQKLERFAFNSYSKSYTTKIIYTDSQSTWRCHLLWEDAWIGYLTRISQLNSIFRPPFSAHTPHGGSKGHTEWVSPSSKARPKLGGDQWLTCCTLCHSLEMNRTISSCCWVRGSEFWREKLFDDLLLRAGKINERKCIPTKHPWIRERRRTK